MRIRFQRDVAPGRGVAFAPLAHVVVDGRVVQVVQPALLESKPGADGKTVATLEIEVDGDPRKTLDRLVEIVLNDRRDVLWTNRGAKDACLPELTAILHPAPASTRPALVPVYQVKSTRDVAAMVGRCFMRATGRLPSRAQLAHAVALLVEKKVTLEELVRQLLAAEDARPWLFDVPVPEDRTESDALVEAVLARWMERAELPEVVPAARKSINITRTQPAANALFQDAARGLYLNLAEGIRYDDGWFSPAATFVAEFDRGFGEMTLLLWRPGIVEGDLAVKARCEGAQVRATFHEGGYAVRVRSTDANTVRFRVESSTDHKPDNTDVRRLGFQVVNVAFGGAAVPSTPEAEHAVAGR